jgi:pilus assembly protein FimV
MKLRPITRHLAAGAMLMALPMWVQAAGLGKLVVTSALGQPLNAEIDLIAADKSELDSINAGLANAQTFQNANVSYAPILSALHFAVVKKPDGQAVLKITSSKPVNDPFLDMLVELNWASGRLVREYTVLLDPPSTAAPQTAAPMAVAAPSITPPAKPAKPVTAKTAASPVSSAPSVKTTATASKAATGQAQMPMPSASAKKTIRVKHGDTLYGIAKDVKPEGVTLEQTLVGLYQANTSAFFGHNMNRLKAGAKLKMPQAGDMSQVSQQKAVKEIQLQASDWQAYRQKLAQGATEETVSAKTEQASSGKITTKVADNAQPKSGEVHDVLKLSKVVPPSPTGATSPEAAAVQKQEVQNAKAEDQIVKQETIKEAGERAALLEKQVQDMQKLVEEKKKKVEAEKAAAAAPTVAAGTQTENWMETLKNNPLYALGGGAIILLGGALWWMVAGTRSKKTITTFEDSIMTGGDLKANTVMGGVPSGGAVNTGDSSFLTDFSQAGIGNIDTHDVDPIAEAEVYMAYGRDSQAEEILKEALNKTPDRQEIRVKLLEIYAGRKNIEAFEKIARELHAAVEDESSPQWQKAAEMGRSIDPENPLYGGQPGSEEPEAPRPADMAAPAAATGLAAGIAEHQSPPEQTSFEKAGQVLDFDSHMSTISGKEEVQREDDDGHLASTMTDLNFDLSEADMEPEISGHFDPESAGNDDAKLDFSGLDLNLDNDMPDEDMDEVATKLDLARAYLEMGDKDGAREILQEVVAEGNSNQQASARGMLSSL